MLFFLGIAYAPSFLALVGLQFLFLLLVMIGLLFQIVGLPDLPSTLLIAAIPIPLLITYYIVTWLRMRLQTLFRINEQAHFPPNANPGPKGRNLAALKQLGGKVPQTYYLPFRTVEKVRNEIEKTGNSRTFKKTVNILTKRANENRVTTWIVRSSSSMEDGTHSFPGIFTSIKDIPVTDTKRLKEAILTVCESYHSQSAQDYAKQLGISIETPENSAVIIQEQIDHLYAGIISSFNPQGMRPDEMRLELIDSNGQTHTAVYDRIMHRLHSEKADPLAIDTKSFDRLRSLLKRCEAYFRHPVVIEFGLRNRELYTYQVRPQTIKPIEVWTNNGPVDLNPDPFTLLQADLTFGTSLAFLQNHLAGKSQQETSTHPIRIQMIHSRTYTNYQDVLKWNWQDATSKTCLNKRQVQELIQKDLPADLPLRQAIIDYRHRLVVQSQLKQKAARYEHTIRFLSMLNLRERFAPIFRWNTYLAAIAKKRSQILLKQVDSMHPDISNQLANLLDSFISHIGSDAPHLTLSEACARMKGSTLPPAEIVLARKIQYEADHANTAPSVWPPPSRNVDSLHTGIQAHFHSLGTGNVEAIGWMPSQQQPKAPKEGYILLLPDMSLKWQELLRQAKGAVFASNNILSHLCLQAIELGVPSITAASTEELFAMNGQKLYLDADRATVKILSDGNRKQIYQ